MKLLLRALVLFALALWVGAECFFPFVAAASFGTLAPDTHRAGLIVGSLLRTLHWLGLGSGLLLLAAIGLSRLYRARRALLVSVGAMMALTAWSQFGIIPRMDRDRDRAGGDIRAAAAGDPARLDFDRLHRVSVDVEEAVLLLGIATVVLVAAGENR